MSTALVPAWLMNPLPMQCPLCAGTIQIDPAHAGQQVACPLCQGVMVLPPPEFFGLPSAGGGYPADQVGFPPSGFAAQSVGGLGPQQYAQETANLTQLGCPVCAGVFQVLPQMTGQQMACPHCHSAVTIPDLFGGAPTGMHLPHGAPAPAPPPPHEMQFIGLPPAVDAASPGYPSSTPAASTPSSPQSRPSGERFPPGVRPEEKPRARERSPDENLYPPGMRPKESAPKPQERAPERSLSDDRFPPGARRGEEIRRDVPQTGHEQFFPPGYQPPAEETEEAKRSAPISTPAAYERQRTQTDDLLPPGAAGASAPDPSPIEELLPPGAPLEAAAGLPAEQIALPEAPSFARKPAPAAGPGMVLVPTPDGGYVRVENREGVTVISDHGEEIEIRKLSPEEKMKRRRRKNMIMFAFGILLLIVVIIIMTRQ